ncbi:unnamed protein product [Fraxinus pennsylvanica]|uniref:K Homology domain-containing protein n=1 Tax=Fraxinus pennsylvanica TaxID=56036 RepID=A0AAD1YWR2_9LAMI|nr:unnamed protein product [Fraxinus pennsylvanica]
MTQLRYSPLTSHYRHFTHTRHFTNFALRFADNTSPSTISLCTETKPLNSDSTIKGYIPCAGGGGGDIGVGHGDGSGGYSGNGGWNHGGDSDESKSSLDGFGPIGTFRLSGPTGMTMDWQGAPASPSSYTVKRIVRLEIPVENYPNFNFVGRLLGPRGNSLKRVEATTGCRVYIRGEGSMKDPDKKEKLRERPGYEHLNEPLHILIEADLPANIVDIRLRQAQEIIEELLKPVDESQDFIKRQQLCELAILNSNFREESPGPGGTFQYQWNETCKNRTLRDQNLSAV